MIDKIKSELYNASLITKPANPNYYKTNKTVYNLKFGYLQSFTKHLSQDEIINIIDSYDDSSFELSIITAELIGKINSFDIAFDKFKSFIKYVDNWATSDKLSQAFKIIRKVPSGIDYILPLLNSNNPWEVRVGMITILNQLNSEANYSIILKKIKEIKATGYYVDMGLAWLLAEMAATNSKLIFEFIEANFVNQFTANKTLQKIRESNKIDKEIKDETYKYKK